MTPEQKAESIVREFLDPKYSHGGIKEAIRVALVEAASDELEKRRAAERKLPPPINGQTGLTIVCTPERTSLRVWNPHRGRWSETNLIEVPEGA